MITHIVAWNFKDEFTVEQRVGCGGKIKSELESLKNYIPELIEICVYTNPAETSGRDIMLYSIFESPEALSKYRVHPNHQRATKFIGTVTKDSICLDFNS